MFRFVQLNSAQYIIKSLLSSKALLIAHTFLLFLLLTLTGCLSGKSTKQFQISGETMGTTYSVKFFAPSPTDLNVVKKKVEETLLEVNRQMSTYIKTSEISEVNNSEKGESQWRCFRKW